MLIKDLIKELQKLVDEKEDAEIYYLVDDDYECKLYDVSTESNDGGGLILIPVPDEQGK